MLGKPLLDGLPGDAEPAGDGCRGVALVAQAGRLALFRHDGLAGRKGGVPASFTASR
jgi:hypothetical protein